MPGKLPRPRAVAFPLAVAALAITLYAPTLHYPMQWDDGMMLVDSPSFASVRSVSDVLTKPYRAFISERREGQPYYRPVNMALLVLERRAFGVEPFGYRVVHAGLHVLCCLLVYALLLELNRSAGALATSGAIRLAAAGGATLFAIAPYGVDTILFLTSAGDQLALAFSLSAVLAGAAFCRGGGVWSFAALAGASVLCVFSKESGAVLPVLFVAFCWATGVKLRSRRFAAAVGVTAFAVAGLLIARAAIIFGSPPFDGVNSLVLTLGGIGKGARFAVAPHPLGMETEVSTSMASPEAIGGAVFLAAGALFAWRVRRSRAVVFGLSWWIVALAPSLLAVACTRVFAARYLYVPAAGAACLASLACATWRRPAFLAVGGVSAAWLLFAVLRVFAWSDDYRLWSREVEINPERAASHVALGTAVLNKGNYSKSMEVFRRAIELAKKRGEGRIEALARSNLCAILTERGDLDEAFKECKASSEADGTFTGVWTALGNAHAADGAWGRALRSYQEAEKRDPGGYTPLPLIALAAAALGDRELAIAYLDKAADIASGSPEKLADLARQRDTIMKYETMPASGAELAEAWLSLGNAHAVEGGWKEALFAYGKAEERDPTSFQPLISIAGAAAALGDREVALRYLEKAERTTEGSREKLADLKRRRTLVLEKLRAVEGGSR